MFRNENFFNAKRKMFVWALVMAVSVSILLSGCSNSSSYSDKWEMTDETDYSDTWEMTDETESVSEGYVRGRLGSATYISDWLNMRLSLGQDMEFLDEETTLANCSNGENLEFLASYKTNSPKNLNCYLYVVDKPGIDTPEAFIEDYRQMTQAIYDDLENEGIATIDVVRYPPENYQFLGEDWNSYRSIITTDGSREVLYWELVREKDGYIIFLQMYALTSVADYQMDEFMGRFSLVNP